METMKLRARVALLGACAVGGTLLGCGTPDVAAPEPAALGTEKDDFLLCNPSSPTVEGREPYVLSAIQLKLTDYPEFATEIGVQSVSNCAEARSFMQKYQEYSAEHPGFDFGQSMPPLEDIPEPDTDLPPMVETNKIRNGDVGFFGHGWPNEPVVHLRRGPVAPEIGPTDCTGTFIAKNWITTAAHCLAGITSTGTAGRRARGYFDWTIEFADANGNLGGSTLVSITSRAKSVLQLPDELWMGDALHDFALLFFRPKTFDPSLPNPGDGSAMLVQKTPPDTSATTFVSGTSNFQGSGPLVLRTGALESITTNPAQVVSVVGSGSQAVSLCTGDSGGPIFQEQQVMLGVFTAFSPGPPAGQPGCTPAGGNMFFWRTDNSPPEEQSTSRFISDRVKKWIGQCSDVTLDNGATAMRCWGPPCQTESDCSQMPVKQFCSKGSREYPDSCPICGFTVGSDCSCIQGQCLPAP